MKNGCLGVFPLHSNHTEVYLSECLNAVIDDFNLSKNKIMAITSDGAPNIDAAVHNVVGQEKHNLVFRSFSIAPSPENELKRLQICDGKTEGTSLKFIIDVATRWNSTLYMLERFLTLEHYVHAVSLKCKRSDIPNMLTRDQTEVLKDLVLLMKPVECIIREISGTATAIEKINKEMKVFENKKDEMTTILQQVEENPEQSNLWKTHDELVASLHGGWQGSSQVNLHEKSHRGKLA
ncbi:uncharacterized protein LOC115239517 [Formica exsecta]|uniref:uncharacterized protein LOC115239517 n=1 Tax=Formica exsecta TaxID=72781 RepID=UPI001144BA65|nr:uncharacterized protein LOC115239517 [Formica exsecta]